MTTVLLPVGPGIAVISALHNRDVSGKHGGRIYCKEKKSPANVNNNTAKIHGNRKNARDRISFIVIDAGHGGRDPGAIGFGSMKEKIITLQIARYMGSSLKKKIKNVTIKQTRRDDRFIELSRRTEIANRMLKKHENGIFVSIHVNASLSPKISGFESYFLSQNPTNEDARNTAALENNVVILEDTGKKGGKKYGDIDYIEAMMITTQIQKESSILAGSVQKGMACGRRIFTCFGVSLCPRFWLRSVLSRIKGNCST